MPKNTGFCWHIHHDKLLEWCYDYMDRVSAIKRWKPPAEIKQRLRLFQFVKGELPDDVIATFGSYHALQKAITTHKAEIEALHAKECPNCTWNGRELVFSRSVQILNFLKRTLAHLDL